MILGVNHVANGGQIWYEYTRVLFDTAGIDAILSPTKTTIILSKVRISLFMPFVCIKLNNYDFAKES